MQKLIVIGEVDIISREFRTRNNSLNIILKEYSSFWGEVYYLGPSKLEASFKYDKCHFIPYEGYSKKFFQRIRFILYPFIFWKYLSHIVNEIKPDLIQIRMPSLFSYIAYHKIKKMKIPITCYVAGEWDKAVVGNFGEKYGIMSIFGKLLFKAQIKIVRNTIVVTAGDVLKERFINYNDCHSYFSTTHKIITIRDDISYPSYKLLSVGRLEGLKRNIDSIYALKQLLQVSDQYSLSFLGDGYLKEDLQKLCKDLKVDTHVRFLGYISDKEQISDIYRSHDILIHSSISEGSPKVLPEAMSYGIVPIAIKNVGSINSIITDNVNGFLAEPKKPDSIFQIINNYNILGKNNAERIVKNCYSYAKEHTIGKEQEKMWNYIFSKVNQ